MTRSCAAISIHFHFGFAADIGDAVKAHPELVCDYTRAMVQASEQQAGTGTVAEGLRLEAKLYEPVGALLTELRRARRADLTGVAGWTPAIATSTTRRRPAVRRSSSISATSSRPCSTSFSRCPVLAVPSGFGARNAPTGVQIAGRTYDDLTVFRVGAALEAVRPWDVRPTVEALAA